MRIGTVKSLEAIEDYCVRHIRVPSIVLMENAALKVIKNIDLKKFNNFTVVCGTGVNGGEGFAAARHLLIDKKHVEIFVVGNIDKLNYDAGVNFEILKNLGASINRTASIEDLNELKESILRSDVVIDAILGRNLNVDDKEIFLNVVSVINENSPYTISIEVPSGLNADTGSVFISSVKADMTVTFEFYKRGFLDYEALLNTGKIIVESIGVPLNAKLKFIEEEFILDRDIVKGLIEKRRISGHKGDYGNVLIFAGKEGFTGAAYISSEACVKSGAGLVTLCTESSIRNVLCGKLVEAMTVSFDESEKLHLHIKKADSIAFGPGMGNSSDTLKRLINVMSESHCPIVIDADGLNALSSNLDILKRKKNEVIITPHLGEMSRLTGMSIKDIEKNRIGVAKEFARKYKVIVLLKGYGSVITDGYKTYINSTGSSAMASGGMGDCLTGIIASLIGQGCSALNAAALGAYIHGYAGDILSKSMYSVSAQEVLKEIPFAMKELLF